jgi:hypothetical protein
MLPARKASDGKNDDYGCIWPPPPKGYYDDEGSKEEAENDAAVRRWYALNADKGIFVSFLRTVVRGLEDSGCMIGLGQPMKTPAFRALMRDLAPQAGSFEDRFGMCPEPEVFPVSLFMLLQNSMLIVLLGGIISREGLNLDLSRMSTVTEFRGLVSDMYLAKVYYLRIQSGTLHHISIAALISLHFILFSHIRLVLHVCTTIILYYSYSYW